MTPARIENDWYVLHEGNRVAGPFQTNGEAWRWIDRQQGEPLNPAQKRSDWIASKIGGIA